MSIEYDKVGGSRSFGEGYPPAPLHIKSDKAIGMRGHRLTLLGGVALVVLLALKPHRIDAPNQDAALNYTRAPAV
jgi:hypothetical protein